MLWFKSRKMAAVEPAPADTPSTPEQSQHSDLADLSARALKDILRTYGAPPHWVSCEAFPLQAPAGVQRFQLVLSMAKWNAQLLKYSLTIQRELLEALWRSMPRGYETEFQVFWVFSPGCEAPALPVPPLASWTESTAASDRRSDFFDRRKAPRPSGPARDPHDPYRVDDLNDDGFEKTAVAPLR